MKGIIMTDKSKSEKKHPVDCDCDECYVEWIRLNTCDVCECFLDDYGLCPDCIEKEGA
jgi:hypothetical protein